jgi:hypothetical protein
LRYELADYEWIAIRLIRTAEPRDVEATWRKVGELLNLFSEQECANYFKNSGYVSA